MNAIAFDTLRFVKRLQAAGYTAEQAEAQAEVAMPPILTLVRENRRIC